MQHYRPVACRCECFECHVLALRCGRRIAVAEQRRVAVRGVGGVELRLQRTQRLPAPLQFGAHLSRGILQMLNVTLTTFDSFR